MYGIDFNMRKILLDKLLNKYKKMTYFNQYKKICELIDEGKLKPIKASGVNGKKPALYNAYWLVDIEKDYSELIEELSYNIVPNILTDYYRNHLKVYEQERMYVLQLNDYFCRNKRDKCPFVSINERSFEIWGREKFIQKEQGRKILNHCGISLEQLRVYETTQPLVYYSANKEVPQSILFVENKDTFYSMRKHLISGQNSILETNISTLIYGGGKAILRSIEDFDFCVEPYMSYTDNEFLYFGDLDYEGIGIYENLRERLKNKILVKPFIKAYKCMIEKAEKREISNLPITSENQNKNLVGTFMEYFEQDYISKINYILVSNYYIPQEILNISDF